MPPEAAVVNCPLSVMYGIRQSRHLIYAVAMSQKIGDGFYVKKLCPRKFSGTGVGDSTMSPIVITIILRVIFTYDYTHPNPTFQLGSQ